jgi:hypothetical protein
MIFNVDRKTVVVIKSINGAKMPACFERGKIKITITY